MHRVWVGEEAWVGQGHSSEKECNMPQTQLRCEVLNYTCPGRKETFSTINPHSHPQRVFLALVQSTPKDTRG